MKKLAVTLVFLLAVAPLAMADQISVTFAFGGTNSVDASLHGVALGPAVNLDVSDKTTGQIFSLNGVSASSTGASTSFAVLTNPNIVLANYAAGGNGSVLVTDGMGHVLISGIMESRGSLVSTYPRGTGAFLGDFLVTSVSPSLLALFGKGPAFMPDGSVSATFGEAELVGADHLLATVGGGSVTIQTPNAVPEPWSLLLYGTGLFLSMVGIRRFNKSNQEK